MITTPPRTVPSRWGRRWTAPWASAAVWRGSGRPSRRSTKPWRARSSICRDGRTPTSRSTSDARRSGGSPARMSRTCCALSRSPRGSRCTWTCSRARTIITRPRPRSRRRPWPCGRRSPARVTAMCLLPREHSMPDVVIVDSGVANLASITSGFARLAAGVVVTRDPTVVRQAPRVVLPGVGAFGAGMGALRAGGLDAAIRDVAASGTPLLGICLGMQLLCEASEETPGVRGLGVIAGACRRLPADVRVPHLGWNMVTAPSNARLVTTGVAAFANSYALLDDQAGWTAAWATHGVRFVAALEHGGVRSVDDARRLLAAGADKVSVNTAAIARPALLREVASEFGSQCVVLAIDAQRSGEGWAALTHGGRVLARADAVEWALEGAGLGAGEILLTSWDRDGTRAGPDLELLRAVVRAVPVPVIASGGIGERDHVAQALSAGANAVLAASVFHDGDDTVRGIKDDLSLRGIRVRR